MKKMNNIEAVNEGKKIAGAGLAVGKFYPPHHGHDFLIDTAQEKSEHLDVIVIARPDELIPGELRAKWVKENHPKANVILRPDTLPEGGSERWAEQTISWL